MAQVQDLIVRKAQLRKTIRCLLDGLEESELMTRSRLVQERLFATQWWRRARWVFAYIAMSVDVDTAPIVTRAYREGRQVAIPRIEGEQITFYRYEGRTRALVPNQFGILEPDPEWLTVDPRELSEGPVQLTSVLALRLDVYAVRLFGTMSLVGTYALAAQLG